MHGSLGGRRVRVITPMAARLAARPVRLGAQRGRRSGSVGMGDGIPSGCWLLQTGWPGHGRRATMSGAVEGGSTGEAGDWARTPAKIIRLH